MESHTDLAAARFCSGFHAWFAIGAGLLGIALAAFSGPLAQAAEWTPSREQNEGAEATIRDYLAAMDDGNYEHAYGMLSSTFRANVSLQRFRESAENVARNVGRVIERRQVKTTWYSNPQNAPSQGIYVAFDLRAKFQNSDRYCGYVVLFLKPDGSFDVVRQEENYLTRDNEQAIEQGKGFSAVEAIWTQLSRHCPN